MPLPLNGCLLSIGELALDPGPSSGRNASGGVLDDVLGSRTSAAGGTAGADRSVDVARYEHLEHAGGGWHLLRPQHGKIQQADRAEGWSFGFARAGVANLGVAAGRVAQGLLNCVGELLAVQTCQVLELGIQQLINAAGIERANPRGLPPTGAAVAGERHDPLPMT
jgi:hypothetical protein